jgi:Concanavalin A-like lectin/glucanases superfamily
MMSWNSLRAFLFAATCLTINTVGVAHAQDRVFDYPFSGSAVDVSGHGHDGAVSGATLVADRFGRPDEAYSFSGGQVISVPDDPSFTLESADFTLSLWMSVHPVSGFSYYVLGHDEGPTNKKKWILWITNGSIGVHVNSPSTGGFWITNHAWASVVGEWVHCAIRRSGDTFTIFANGQSIGSNIDTRAIPDPNTTFTMGDAESQHPERDFRGSLDDVRLYNRALSDGEIQGIAAEATVPIRKMSFGALKSLYD